MTDLHPQHRTFAQNMRNITGLQGGDVGVLPDLEHMDPPAGYHVGVLDIIQAGRFDKDYSTRQERDRLKTNWASGWDVGDNWPNGGRAAWLRWNNMLFRHLVSADPELAAIRAINFSPDGVQRKRYDTNNRSQGVINSTDTVTTHTHGEGWRDTIGTPALDRAFRRIEAMARAAIANEPIDNGGPFMALTTEQQHDLWVWLAAMMDPNTPLTGRPDDRFHFPPPFVVLNQKMTVINNALAASATREQDMLAALSALASAGSNVDTAVIIAAINARSADVTGLLESQAAEIEALRAELAATKEAAQANLSAAEKATLDGNPDN